MSVSILFFSVYTYSLLNNINLGRLCHGSYHWRCLKPETVSEFGDNRNFICEKCNENPTPSPSQKVINGGGIKIKSTDSTVRDYRDFVGVPSKSNSTDTSIHNTIRYFEEKQQQSQVNRTTKISDIDAYLPSPTSNGKECYPSNGKTENIYGKSKRKEKIYLVIYTFILNCFLSTILDLKLLVLTASFKTSNIDIYILTK